MREEEKPRFRPIKQSKTGLQLQLYCGEQFSRFEWLLPFCSFKAKGDHLKPIHSFVQDGMDKCKMREWESRHFSVCKMLLGKCGKMGWEWLEK